MSLCGPQVLRFAIDDLKVSITHHKLLLYASLILGVALVEGVLRYFMRRILIGISRDIEFDLRNDLFSKLLRLPRPFYDAYPTGDIMNRCSSDVNSVRMLLGPGIMYSINTLAIFSIGIVMMFRIDVRLTVLSLIPLPLSTIVVYFFSRRIYSSYHRVQEYFSDVTTYLQENFSGVRLLRAYGCFPSRRSRFACMMDSYITINRRLIATWGLFYPMMGMLGGLGGLVVLLYGGSLVISGRITLGAFVAFSIYLAMLAWPMMSAGWVLNLFQRGAASQERLNVILDGRGVDTSSPGVVAVPSHPPGIEFRNLTFRYPGADSDALRSVSFHVPGGSIVGIVGRVGCGKSTLASILSRIYDPPAGSVFIDGRDITAIPLGDLRRLVTVVPQESFLFSETIAENIGMGGRTKDLMTLASIAGLDSDLRTFPQGLETLVGERGITLSGGQKQRVTIARALARGASVIIFDDSLSSVDVETENEILRGIQEHAGTHTLLIISHRISSIKTADLIAVFQDGELHEIGNHSDLIDRNGLYASLFHREEIEEELARL